MASKKNLILPKTFTDFSKDGKYKHLDGKPKLSYSQVNSWKDVKYKPDYIKKYFVGIDVPGNMFTDYGSAVGTYIESIGTNDNDCHKEYEHWLSDFDREFLNSMDYPDNCVYEDMIVVDCGRFVMEGYIDRSLYEGNKISIRDFKTGSIDKKTSEYSSPDYNQTTLYSYQKELEGYEIIDSEVALLDRAGNNSAKSPIRLTGKISIIPTPYSTERALNFLKSVENTAEEISEAYQKYLKFFT